MKHRTTTLTPDIQARIDAAVDAIAVELADDLKETFGGQSSLPFESPLEALFYAWWTLVDRIDHVDRFDLNPQRDVVLNGTTYRLDFAVTPGHLREYEHIHSAGLEFPDIAVELDGHDFHERTKEQVVTRDRRDRALQMAGWTVFHFSGSEFIKDPRACIDVVRGHATTEWARLECKLLDIRYEESRRGADTHAQA